MKKQQQKTKRRAERLKHHCAKTVRVVETGCHIAYLFSSPLCCLSFFDGASSFDSFSHFSFSFGHSYFCCYPGSLGECCGCCRHHHRRHQWAWPPLALHSPLIRQLGCLQKPISENQHTRELISAWKIRNTNTTKTRVAYDHSPPGMRVKTRYKKDSIRVTSSNEWINQWNIKIIKWCNATAMFDCLITKLPPTLSCMCASKLHTHMFL